MSPNGHNVGAHSVFPSPEELPAKLQQALDMFRDGHSKHVIAVDVFDVDIDTLDKWIKAKPAFGVVIKRGIQLSRSWWEKQAKQSLTDKSIAAVPLIFNMKCRFPDSWRENNTLELPPGDITIQWRTGGQSAARAGKRR